MFVQVRFKSSDVLIVHDSACKRITIFSCTKVMEGMERTSDLTQFLCFLD